MHLGLRLVLPFAAGYFLSYLLRNVNAIIAPGLTRELGVSAADLGLLTAAFLVQWGYGVLLDVLKAPGWTPTDSHRAAVMTLLVLQAAGLAWFLCTRDRPSTDP